MAVPKRKTSTSGSMNILSQNNWRKCYEDKKSGEYRLSHHIDLKTGVYNGKKF